MSGTTSILPDTMARLIDLLRASGDLIDVDVAWTRPPAPSREVIYFGKVTGTSEVANMRAGRKSRNETCTLTVIIDTRPPGNDAETAIRRVTEIYAVIEDLLADDISLVGAQGDDVDRMQRIPGVGSVVMESYTSGPEEDIEGYAGVMVATVSVSARLN